MSAAGVPSSDSHSSLLSAPSRDGGYKRQVNDEELDNPPTSVEDALRVLHELGIAEPKWRLRMWSKRSAKYLDSKVAKKIIARIHKVEMRKALDALSATDKRVVRHAIHNFSMRFQRDKEIKLKRGRSKRKRVRVLISNTSDSPVITNKVEIAAGGVKRVFASLRLGRDAAVFCASKKVKDPDNASLVERGHRAWKSVSTLSDGSCHPGLIPVDYHTVETKRGKSFLVVEAFESGPDFFQLLEFMKVDYHAEPLEWLLDMLEELLPVFQGVAHLHANDVAHLDFKPENINVTEDGCKLADPDFVITREDFDGGDDDLRGTPEYMPSKDGDVVAWEKFDDCKYQDCYGMGATLEAVLEGITQHWTDEQVADFTELPLPKLVLRMAEALMQRKISAAHFVAWLQLALPS